MTTLLHLDSSLNSADGESSRLAGEFVRQWREREPGLQVIHRDLAAQPLPHLTRERFQAFITPPEARTPAQQAEVASSDALIAELKRADVIVLGLPMYNFGVPSTLKAYFDHVGRAGQTFRYTERGPQGLLQARHAYVFTARGGVYSGSPLDTQTAYVRDFWRFLGVREIDFVHAEGLAMGPEPRAKSLAGARAALPELVTRATSAQVEYAAA